MTKKNTAGLREVGNTWSVEKKYKRCFKSNSTLKYTSFVEWGKGEWQNVIPTSPSRTP